MSYISLHIFVGFKREDALKDFTPEEVEALEYNDPETIIALKQQLLEDYKNGLNYAFEEVEIH